MAVDVEDDVVVLAGDRRNDAEVRLVSGREHHGVIHGVKVLERILDRAMADISSVQNAASGGPRAELVERLLARRDHVRVEGHAHVVVRAEQDRPAAVADGDSRAFDLLHHQVERVGDPARKQAFAKGDQLVELGEEIGQRSPSSWRTASISWSTVSISAARFMLMRMSNSSSTEATKSITVRLSHSRSWAKRVLPKISTPFLLKGSMRSRILASMSSRSVMVRPYSEARPFATQSGAKAAEARSNPAPSSFPEIPFPRTSPAREMTRSEAEQ